MLRYAKNYLNDIVLPKLSQEMDCYIFLCSVLLFLNQWWFQEGGVSCLGCDFQVIVLTVGDKVAPNSEIWSDRSLLKLVVSDVDFFSSLVNDRFIAASVSVDFDGSSSRLIQTVAWWLMWYFRGLRVKGITCIIFFAVVFESKLVFLEVVISVESRKFAQAEIPFCFRQLFLVFHILYVF